MPHRPLNVPRAPIQGPSSNVMMFKKGIKRDPTLLDIFKNDRSWDSWNTTLKAQAVAQDVSEVIDTTYVPITEEDRLLFAEKQKYMYSVFERTLRTDTGKALVRRFEHSYDAQRIYKHLADHALRSTAASVSSSHVLAYVTSVRIDTANWTGGTYSFILHWQEQVRLYETMTPSHSHFTDELKKTLLQSVVHPMAELRSVKNEADQLRVQTSHQL